METVSKRVIETYKNIYLGPFLNKKEKFQETSTSVAETSSSLAPATFTSTSVAETSSSLAPATFASTSVAETSSSLAPATFTSTSSS